MQLGLILVKESRLLRIMILVKEHRSDLVKELLVLARSMSLPSGRGAWA